MKYFTTILALASVLNFTSASPSTGVIPIRRAEGIHKREPLCESLCRNPVSNSQSSQNFFSGNSYHFWRAALCSRYESQRWCSPPREDLLPYQVWSRSRWFLVWFHLSKPMNDPELMFSQLLWLMLYSLKEFCLTRQFFCSPFLWILICVVTSGNGFVWRRRQGITLRVFLLCGENWKSYRSSFSQNLER